MGMCFGVRDAINLAERHAAWSPLTILGELVHNEDVIDGLRARGIHFENKIENVRTETLMVTAHGISNKRLAQIRKRGLEAIEATCPLVHYAHRSLGELVARGAYPIVIGKVGHVEVNGLVEDLAEASIILSISDIQSVPVRPVYGVVAQTTQPIQRVRNIVAALRSSFPNATVHFIDTVCQPTKRRQTAAVTLARRCDVVVVIGGVASNNTLELVATCRQVCPKVFHVQDADHLNPAWFEGAHCVGITAGTSTPESTIKAVESRLGQIAAQFY